MSSHRRAERSRGARDCSESRIALHGLRIVPAQPADLDRYIDLLEGLADWLAAQGIRQWRPGTFRESAPFYAESIERQEVLLAIVDGEWVGTFRLLLREPIVWPEIVDDDAVYIYNLAVKRAWAGRGLGQLMLCRAGERAASLGRSWIRLDCMADNPRLRAYYTAAGFEEHGEIDAAFPAPVGALRLQRYEKRVVSLPACAPPPRTTRAADGTP